MRVSKMIVNWFGLHPRTGKSKYREVVNNIDDSKPAEISKIYMNECPFVREFVIKIAEKMRDRSFVYSETFYGCIERNLEWKDIKVTVNMGSLYLYVFNEIITLNLHEEELIGKEWNILRDERVKIEMEKDKLKQDAAIKAAEEYFND